MCRQTISWNVWFEDTELTSLIDDKHSLDSLDLKKEGRQDILNLYENNMSRWGAVKIRRMARAISTLAQMRERKQKLEVKHMFEMRKKAFVNELCIWRNWSSITVIDGLSFINSRNWRFKQ